MHVNKFSLGVPTVGFLILILGKLEKLTDNNLNWSRTYSLAWDYISKTNETNVRIVDSVCEVYTATGGVEVWLTQGTNKLIQTQQDEETATTVQEFNEEELARLQN